MEVKSNVRQRRRDRMKALQEQPQQSFRPSSSQHSVRMDELENIPDPYALYDKRLEDPEFVWKHRKHQFGWQLQDPFETGRQRENESWREWSVSPTRGQLAGKLLICLLLFGLVTGMFQLRTPWAIHGQEIVKMTLTKDTDFARIASWYEKTFRSVPSILPAFGLNKNKQSAVEKFSAPIQGNARIMQDHQGLMLSVPAHTFIQAAATGRVMYVGQTEATGYTVVIQHAGSMQTVYGWLEGCSLENNDWVEGGQIIGQPYLQENTKDGELYFAVKKDNRYINPLDVISFD